MSEFAALCLLSTPVTLGWLLVILGQEGAESSNMGLWGCLLCLLAVYPGSERPGLARWQHWAAQWLFLGVSGQLLISQTAALSAHRLSYPRLLCGGLAFLQVRLSITCARHCELLYREENGLPRQHRVEEINRIREEFRLCNELRADWLGWVRAGLAQALSRLFLVGFMLLALHHSYSLAMLTYLLIACWHYLRFGAIKELQLRLFELDLKQESALQQWHADFLAVIPVREVHSHKHMLSASEDL
jgi:hypothetical protein